jgi:uncharacterized protein YbjT (DUF2867 family)
MANVILSYRRLDTGAFAGRIFDRVAAATAQILWQSPKPYPVYELAGPRVYSYEDLLRTIARVAGSRPALMPIA